MNWALAPQIRRWFSTEEGAADRLLPRWLFLRALGLIYFSAFYALSFQILGLNGPQGILPAGEYLQAVARSFGIGRIWFAPTLFWFSSGSHMLIAICWAGMAASVLLVVNIWPRGMAAVCFACFLSFVSAAGDFSSYQSDGMLLEAGFISLFFAPRGFLPGLGRSSLPSRASLFLLQWEWFRIYFESGIAKLASGDPEWRNLTAMDEYYQNGPLPTWIGWYVQHLPHRFHAASAVGTLVLELVIVWMLFSPRRSRIVCFWIATAWQIGVILTANYAFLNYIVLVLGFLLTDDRILIRFLPQQWARRLFPEQKPENTAESESPSSPVNNGIEPGPLRKIARVAGLVASTVMLSWILYATVAQLIWLIEPQMPLPSTPVVVLDPFRIANRYGLFAVMTRGRYEIEFQGSNDGQNWVAYPFRYKPQDPAQSPGIYAPYQPRFDWNLWFASLGSWRQYPFVPRTEERLLINDADVLHLFAGNPFPQQPPHRVRAVLWQYWFTTEAEKRTTGDWWRREYLGLYAPTLERDPDGTVNVVEEPPAIAPQESR